MYDELSIVCSRAESAGNRGIFQVDVATNWTADNRSFHTKWLRTLDPSLNSSPFNWWRKRRERDTVAEPLRTTCVLRVHGVHTSRGVVAWRYRNEHVSGACSSNTLVQTSYCGRKSSHERRTLRMMLMKQRLSSMAWRLLVDKHEEGTIIASLDCWRWLQDALVSAK